MRNNGQKIAAIAAFVTLPSAHASIPSHFDGAPEPAWHWGGWCRGMALREAHRYERRSGCAAPCRGEAQGS